MAWLCWKIDVGLPWEALALVGRRPVETLFTTLHRHLIMLTERSRHHPPYITYLPYFCRTLWVRSTDLSMPVPIFAFCKSFSSLHYSPSTDKNCEFVYVPACRLVSLYLFFLLLFHHLLFVIIVFLSWSYIRLSEPGHHWRATEDNPGWPGTWRQCSTYLQKQITIVRPRPSGDHAQQL